MKPSKKQVEALRWLLAREQTDKIDSTALYPMYQAASDLRAHALRVVAWKRISGRNMAGMQRAGLLRYHSTTYGSGRVVYSITESGLRAAEGGER